ncbi:hypothetical protein ACFQZI_14765 [Mucilaginibacter lutimaris]|uniref:Uncharacterized protein n=1 Tax=Mucilaginibacter lutimaris TaxID=931629 RepID=A0ABW2ZIW9_9SPHI
MEKPGKIVKHIRGNTITAQDSYGGVLATSLAKQLAEANIKVDLLITVDAANGPLSSFVDRDIPGNVQSNINYFETNKGTLLPDSIPISVISLENKKIIVKKTLYKIYSE